MTDIGHSIRRGVALGPRRIALIDGDVELDWGTLADRVGRCAGALRAAGWTDGTRIAILSENSHRYIELIFGAASAGAITVPLNFRLAETELASILADAEPAAIFASPAFLDVAVRLGAARGIAVRSLAPGQDGYEAMIAAHPPWTTLPRGGDDVAVLYYTSGTSGSPKGVMLTHDNLFTAALSAMNTLRVTPDSVSMIPSPFFHVAALALLLPTMMAGARAIIVPRFTIEDALDTLRRHRPTIAVLVNTILEFLLNDPAADAIDLSRLEAVMFGASALRPALRDQMVRTLAGKRLLHGYGMTEATTIVSMMDFATVPAGDPRQEPSSIGRAVAGVEVSIAGAQQPGEIGEILVRGPTVMKGYWRKPDETRAALADGWLHTGDLGYLDDGGHLFIVDRLKDMIITGGENVYSVEVERVVDEHPAVEKCVVIGGPDPKWGETVVAVIRLRPGAAIEADAIIAHCRDRIAGYKVPRRIILRTEEFPVNAAGKLVKTALRSEYFAAAT
ncbi:MAG: class I adenylate-forming enzyme family protein [Sphingobium sp.]